MSRANVAPAPLSMAAPQRGSRQTQALSHSPFPAESSRMSNDIAHGCPESVDLLIVGAGMAGLATAAEVETHSGPRTLVVEAGPDAGQDHFRWAFGEEQANTQWLHPETDPWFWRPYTTTGSSFMGLAGLRRRVGGRSLYWHGVTLPMEPWALRDPRWPEEVIHDLTVSWDGGDPLFSRVEQTLAQWAYGPDRVALGTGHTLELGTYRFQETPQAVQRSGSDGRWRAYSPLDQWSGRTEIRQDCHVLGVTVDGGRATGVQVRYDGEIRHIRAAKVVLAAGTIENTRLAVQALHDCEVLRTPSLSGLVDKVVFGSVLTFDPDSVPPELLRAAHERRFLVSACDDSLRSNLFLRLFVNKFGVLVVDAWLMGEQTPGPSGTVTCRPTDQWPWPTTVDCALGSEDEQLVRAQQAELQGLSDELGALAGMPGRVLEFDDFGSPDLPKLLMAADAIEKPSAPWTYSFELGYEQHEAATLPLGGLLDSDGQFKDVQGLFATGPAVFPRTGAANPTMTILALARRLGKTLAET